MVLPEPSIEEPFCPHLHTLPTVKRRPDVEEKREIAVWRPWVVTSVKVNDIPHGCTATIDDPVMAIKGRRVTTKKRELGNKVGFALDVPKERPPAGLQTPFSRFSFEID